MASMACRTGVARERRIGQTGLFGCSPWPGRDSRAAGDGQVSVARASRSGANARTQCPGRDRYRNVAVISAEKKASANPTEPSTLPGTSALT